MSNEINILHKKSYANDRSYSYSRVEAHARVSSVSSSGKKREPVPTLALPASFSAFSRNRACTHGLRPGASRTNQLLDGSIRQRIRGLAGGDPARHARHFNAGRSIDMRLTLGHPLRHTHHPRARSRAGVAVPALLAPLAFLLLTSGAGAQGVPVIDGQSTVLHTEEVARETALRTEMETASAKRDEISRLHDEQIAALDATLALLTHAAPFIGDLEDLPGGLAASEVYAIEDSNPYAGRLFGDARVTIEEMIIETARRYGGHPALARAGINPVEFRCWFQGLVKQESGFSIGAQSPAAAFGLTQIIPGTAKYLGIYPAYYDDPQLQLDGGARYLLEQLDRFGSMPLALAAYNSGPGAVQEYGGIPPYRETEDYVVRVTANYNSYANRIEGVDTVGTLDPADMVIAESSNIADAGLHYGMHSSAVLTEAMTRLNAIIERIPTTASTKEAMDLNTYARAEVTRIAYTLQRLAAVRVKVEQARYALLLQAYAEDELFLVVKD
jgi:hypothetical protein